ncbi:MAG: bifunctional adenosylcobinamide kinase/adenosylcobinamide-phosphate guanylyltransferase [Lachnospiraceae bacterium]|nr:bifunctional adenosylcobinamide kinase/adenosylcobinamide-phosphate guanylyltransferase [Lachnospiraceae bacterium]
MRELYIGGVAQGKLPYVRRVKSEEKTEIKVIDCAEWQTAEAMGQSGCVDGTAPGAETPLLVFYHFHLWVRHMIFAGADAEQAFGQFLAQYPDWVIVSDEVGNGIVPMEKEERAYRECLGRILIEAAKQADRVERVMCGLGQRIK